MRLPIGLLTCLTLLSACKSIEPDRSDAHLPMPAPVVTVVSGSPDDSPEIIPVLPLVQTDLGAKAVKFHDAAQIDTAFVVDANFLQIEMHFGGGCEAHDIDAFAKQDLRRAEADIYLSHDAHDDHCEAWLGRTYKIDLGAMIASAQASLGHGNLKLHIHSPEGGDGISTALLLPF